MKPPITPREYDAIKTRLKQLRGSDEAIRQVAAEFDRSADTVKRLRGWTA
jgi:hypothetical protein